MDEVREALGSRQGDAQAAEGQDQPEDPLVLGVAGDARQGHQDQVAQEIGHALRHDDRRAVVDAHARGLLDQPGLEDLAHLPGGDPHREARHVDQEGGAPVEIDGEQGPVALPLDEADQVVAERQPHGRGEQEPGEPLERVAEAVESDQDRDPGVDQEAEDGAPKHAACHRGGSSQGSCWGRDRLRVQVLAGAAPLGAPAGG